MRRTALGLLLLGADLLGAAAQPSRAAETTRPELVLRSVDHGYGYGYGPAILRTEGGWEMIYCSDPGASGALDALRQSRSRDGRRWTAPTVALQASGERADRAVCDPSVVRYQAPGDGRPYYYLFYSGTPLNVQTAMFVARSTSLGGPFAKWTGSGWEVDAERPKAIILPTQAKPEGANFYGAGQQSVVVKDGRLFSWFTDDTTCGERPCVRTFMSTAEDPTRWAEKVPTNIEGLGSVDVKYDRERGRFVMYAIPSAHADESRLVRYASVDGVTWTGPEPVGAENAILPFSHNVGVSGDDQGHLVKGRTLVVFGATDPADPKCGICWGRWNLYRVLVSD